MKIAIVGSGALGSLLAALFFKAKADAVLFSRSKERADKIERDGINVEGAAGKWKARVKASSSFAGISGAGVVFLCVKSYDTKNAVSSFSPYLAKDAVVISLQNGLGNIEVISEAVDETKVIGGVTNIGATLLEDGGVRYAGKGETVIGRTDGKVTAEMRPIRELFSSCGLELRISREIKSIIWSKLVLNAGINALSAVLRLPNGALVKSEGARRIMRAAVTEAVRVAKRKRIKLAYDDPLAKAEAVCEATAANISSMLQDILAGRRSEIDAINGAIIRIAQESGIPVPVNILLNDMVKSIEDNYAG